jgi:Ca2+-transporting ATPase
MWFAILFVGFVSALATLTVLDACLPGGFIEGSGDMRYARTMGFTTQVFISLIAVFSARSDDRSAFNGLFTNVWLWGAVGLGVALQILVIYVPFLQQAFSTTALAINDWLFCAVAASSVLWLRELSKVIVRKMGST